MIDYTAAGRGLNKMFIGEILSILSFIPLVGGILALVGLILTLVGLNEASAAADGYRTAFWTGIVSIVVDVLAVFLSPLGVVSSILSFVMVYLVCITTADILDETGDPATAAKGRFVWKLYVVCTVIIVVCALLALIPGVVVLAALVMIPTVIATLVAGIQYLIFLYRASSFLS